VPSAAHRPAGCLLAPRCAFAVARCSATRPALQAVAAHSSVRCHFPLVIE
jgi:dipeptide transport system ATP-binding protein